MKRLSMLISLCAVACPTFAHELPSHSHSPLVEIQTPPDRNVAVIAHRGCWQDGAPEVSVSAIKACDLLKPDVIEVDVRRTADGALIMIHDDTVDRTTNGSGVVAEMTFDQVRALRLKERDGGPDTPITDEKIPTLKETLEAARGKSILHLHLYTDAYDEVVKTVRALNMTDQVTTWVSGGNLAELSSSPLLGSVGLIPIITDCNADAETSCDPQTPISLNGFNELRPTGYYVIPRTGVTSQQGRRFIQDIVSENGSQAPRIMASTLFLLDKLPLHDLHTEWQKLIDLGVDMIMTDRPADLLNFLKAEKIALSEN